MTVQTFKRILALAMACVLMLALSAEALAEQIRLSGSAAVYASPSGSARKLGTLKSGTKVNVVARKSGWAMVKKGGKTAYIKASALKSEKKASGKASGGKTVYAATDGAKVYNASGAVIGKLSLNEKLTLVATKGKLCQVRQGGKTAYMYRSDISSSKTAKAEKAAAATKTMKAYVKRDGAKLYNSKGKAIGTLDANAALTVTGVNGNVCAVDYGGKTAYMKKGDLSARKVAVKAAKNAGVTAYVNRDGAKVYDAKGKAIGALKANAALKVTAVRGSLCQVTHGGKTAYMKKADLSSKKVSTRAKGHTAYVKRDGARVYSARGKAIGTLDVNAAVTVTAVKGSLCQVTHGDKTAYMKKADLSANKVNADTGRVALKYGDSGDAVAQLQRRLQTLGYFSGSIGGNYKDITQGAVAAFQSAAKLNSTGIADYQTLEAIFSDDAPHKPIPKDSGNSTVAKPTGKVVEVDWWTSDIQKIFPRGATATITDVETGLSWREQRRGGTNHADVQPLTAADTAALKKAYGGAWSWSRRAVIVTINGVNYAASMNGMPHGGGSISTNNFNGHHCIHFTNSRTHGGNRICPLHQAAIKKALAAKL